MGLPWNGVGQTSPRNDEPLDINFTISTVRLDGTKGRNEGIFTPGYLFVLNPDERNKLK